MAIAPDDLKRFMLLYRANTRSFGNWDPRTKNTHTEKRDIKYDDFVGHFNGHMGVGCVPLRDDNTCYWGAIDIDNHGSSEDTDIKSVEASVQAHGYPLVTCRSKSGGVHLYLFLSEPVKAEIVRRVLKLWADALQVPGTDCLFPKHDKMNRDFETGIPGLSNWINFPYFDCVSRGTNRYAVINGKPAELGAFLDYAEGNRQSNSDIQKWANADHSEAPPCLQSKFLSGFTPGERNTGVYQITVYARKKERDPEASSQAANELAEQYMPDIKYGERQKTIKSALSKTYNYKCEEFKEVCDKEACRKRKYGVSEVQYRDMRSKESIPRFFEAIMWTGMDEPRWSIKAEVPDTDKTVEYEVKYMSTDELRKMDLFKKKMIESTPVFLPPIKQGEWESIIGPVMSSKIIMPMPESTSIVGGLKSRLTDFLGRAKANVDMGGSASREPLLRGLPVHQEYKGMLVIMFRSQDFEKYLRDTKTDKPRDLWLKMKDEIGVDSARIRVGKTLVSVHLVVALDFEPQEFEKVDLEPEY